MQIEDRAIFITFSTYKRWPLPDLARSLVFKHCCHDHGVKLQMHGLVIMPDHVHMVLTPLKDPDGQVYGLAETMHGIKSTSAHSINKLLKRQGRVWEEESFDRILRSEESIITKVEYICQNPVRKGLVNAVDDYPWLWREWVEGAL
jgi:REP element-mobilizing transposase RayT